MRESSRRRWRHTSAPLRSTGTTPQARARLAALAARLQRYELSERHLRVLLEMNYQPARTYLGLGRVAQMQGRAADAAANYREALRLEPGLPMALEGLRSLGIQ